MAIVPPRSPGMPRERYPFLLLKYSNLLVGVTGILYAFTHYLLPSPDPFRPVHPLDPWAQRLHVLTAPLLVFAGGAIFFGHALENLRKGSGKRRSGILLLASFFPLVFSGYGIQVASEVLWQRIWVAVHLITAGLWLLGYGIHASSFLRREKGVRENLDEPAQENYCTTMRRYSLSHKVSRDS